MDNFSDILSFIKKIPLSQLPAETAWDSQVSEDPDEFLASIFKEDYRKKLDLGNLCAGDLILVRSFDSNGTTVDNKEHRILYLTSTLTNNINKAVFYGFPMSTQVRKSAANGGKFTNMVFVPEYNSILAEGSPSDTSVVVNVDACAEFTTADLLHGKASLVGKVKPEFLTFIQNCAREYHKDPTKMFAWDPDSAE